MELWRLAKSPMLVRTIESLVSLPFAAPSALVFTNAEVNGSSTMGSVALEHYRSIVEAIANREGTRAEALAREHARVGRRNLASALKDRTLFNQVPGASLLRLSVPMDAL
jgi:GntR family transcriptional regulator of vanillate catabolism